jgi:ribosome-associated protein
MHSSNEEEKVIGLAKLLDEHKTENTVVLNMGKKNSFTDYFVISTVRSQTHLKGLVDRVLRYLKDNNISVLHGVKKPDNVGWLLIDCGYFVIHLFENEMRDFYDLEKLWFKSELMYQSSKSS